MVLTIDKVKTVCTDFIRTSDCANNHEIIPKSNKFTSNDLPSDDEWVFVFPVSWSLDGGFIIRTEILFLKYHELSILMEDDFDVYDSCFHSMLSCRGDRSGEELIRCDVKSSGEYTNFFYKSLHPELTTNPQPKSSSSPDFELQPPPQSCATNLICPNTHPKIG